MNSRRLILAPEAKEGAIVSTNASVLEGGRPLSALGH
jgi:hypothetical protein